MNRILLIIFIFAIGLLGNDIETSQSKVLKDFGLDARILKENSFKSIYNEYSSGKKISYYNNLLRKSSLNVQIVRELIETRNMPQQVFFIPLLESSYVNQSKNKTGPSGLWQIMPQTAKTLKLRVDEQIDERLDLIKSTNAAGNYLKRYYKVFDKWYLSIIAYNAGEGRVISGIARASLDKYLDENPSKHSDPTIKVYKNYISEYQRTKKGMSNLYTIYERYSEHYDYIYLLKNNHRDYLPKTSVNYINKLLAFSLLANKNSFKAMDGKSRYDLEQVKAPKGLELRSLANLVGMDYNEFRNINKHIKKEKLPIDSKSYNIYIPHYKLDVYNQKIANIGPIIQNNVKNNNQKQQTKDNSKAIVKNNKNNNIIYTVKAGDTLGSIAIKHGLSSSRKLKIIKRKKDKVLSIGDRIEIIK